MKFSQMLDKHVKITCTDGQVICGVVDEITSAADNEPNGACCSVGDVEILESEIKSIEQIGE